MSRKINELIDDALLCEQIRARDPFHAAARLSPMRLRMALSAHIRREALRADLARRVA